jgi:putative phosphoesterase
MTRIGILSDTHGLLDKRIFAHFKDVDEIWHAGDIGSDEVLRKLREFKPTRAVFGNMDSGDIRYSLDEFYRFRVEDVNVLMTHIGGYPGHYNPWLIPIFSKALENYDDPNHRIDLFVCGHSHILKVQYDKALGLLHINPGAAGLQGWHTVRTLVRFSIDAGNFSDLEVIEMPR